MSGGRVDPLRWVPGPSGEVDLVSVFISPGSPGGWPWWPVLVDGAPGAVWSDLMTRIDILTGGGTP